MRFRGKEGLMEGQDKTYPEEKHARDDSTEKWRLKRDALSNGIILINHVRR